MAGFIMTAQTVPNALLGGGGGLPVKGSGG